jgi:hypothetical protein
VAILFLCDRRAYLLTLSGLYAAGLAEKIVFLARGCVRWKQAPRFGTCFGKESGRHSYGK